MFKVVTPENLNKSLFVLKHIKQSHPSPNNLYDNILGLPKTKNEYNPIGI